MLDEQTAIIGEQHLQHTRVLARYESAERCKHTRRELQVTRDCIQVARPRAAAATEQELVLALQRPDFLEERKHGRPASVQQ